MQQAEGESSDSKPVTVTVTATAPDVRKKVPLTPGHTLGDWLKIVNSGKTYAGGTTGGAISIEVLRKHNHVDVGVWTAIHGRVYNITPYLEFHPGGVEEIMKAAGKDGTSLFNKKHPWVNVEAFLKNCYVGNLIM